MNYRFVATCLFGLEHTLGEEIDALGYKRLETIDGRIIFEGDISAVARCNIWLRTAERVFLLLGRYRATTFSDLFDGAYDIPWEQWIGRDDAFP
jgi:putative N6-adenine-specific DNA methylase